MTGSAQKSEFDAVLANAWAEREPEGFALLSEYRYRVRLHDLAGRILGEGDRVRAVLLAGPSASSKTTTAQKLVEELAMGGRDAVIVSIDDFFFGLDRLPRLPDGAYDMETLAGVDVELARQCFNRLLETGRAELPLFDFGTQSRSERTRPVELSPEGILLIEGTHALNPAFAEGLPGDGVFRVYVGVMTGFELDGREALSPRDMRLARRIVRDELFRGWSAEKTLMQWPSVCAGEAKFIDPYRDTADALLDSALDYEPAVLGGRLLPLLAEIGEGSPYAAPARGLFARYSQFTELRGGAVPEDSLLREFIGR